MSEMEPKPPEGTMFIQDSALFFGQPLEYGVPQRTTDRLINAEAQSARSVEAVYREYTDSLTSWRLGEDFRSEPPTFDMAKVDYARQSPRHYIMHNLYEQRCRGRNFPEDIEEKYSRVFNYVFERETESEASSIAVLDPLFHSRGDASVPETPPAEEIAAAINECLLEQQWYRAYATSKNWCRKLDEDSPDLETARSYTAFAMNMIVTYYCQQSIALANPNLAADYRHRTKHLMTVCWPFVEELGEYAPEEAATKRQLLREIFLEYAFQGIGVGELKSFAGFAIQLSGIEVNNNDDNTDFYDLAALEYVLRIHDTVTPDRLELLQLKFDEAIEVLGAQGKYMEQMELLDVGILAFGLDEDVANSKKKFLVGAAIAELTKDMSKFKPSQFGHDVDPLKEADWVISKILQSCSSLGEVECDRLEAIVGQKWLEYLDDEYQSADEVIQYKILEEAIYEINSDRKGLLDVPISLQQAIHIHYMQQVDPEYPAYSTTQKVEQLLRTANRIDLVKQDVRRIITDWLEAIVDSAVDPDFKHPLMRFNAVIASFIDLAAIPEDPKQEVLWRYVDPQLFNGLMESLRVASFEASGRIGLSQRAAELDTDIIWLQKLLDNPDELRSWWREMWRSGNYEYEDDY